MAKSQTKRMMEGKGKMLWNLEGLKGQGMKGRDNGKSNGVARYTKDS